MRLVNCVIVCYNIVDMILFEFELDIHFQKLSTILQKDADYRNCRCIHPWASLFIWAVLQNRSEMAIYFWEMVIQCQWTEGLRVVFMFLDAELCLIPYFLNLIVLHVCQK